MTLEVVEDNHSVYDYPFYDSNGILVPWDLYKSKVLLIVNTATNCGLSGQFAELEDLKRIIRNPNFEVLAFPANDFLNQEPRSNAEIISYCHRKYRISYPIFSKIRVRGNNAHPLFKYLSQKRKNGMINVKPKWNFHKYLVNGQGKVIDHYYSFTRPTAKHLIQKIEKLLANEN